MVLLMMGCVLDRQMGNTVVAACRGVARVTFDFSANSNANRVKVAEVEVLWRKKNSTRFWGVTDDGSGSYGDRHAVLGEYRWPQHTETLDNSLAFIKNILAYSTVWCDLKEDQVGLRFAHY